MCEQNASYLLKDSTLGAKNLNKIFLKNCTESTKMAITLQGRIQEGPLGLRVPPSQTNAQNFRGVKVIRIDGQVNAKR